MQNPDLDAFDAFAERRLCIDADTLGYGYVTHRLAVGKIIYGDDGRAMFTATCYTDEWVAKTITNVYRVSFDTMGNFLVKDMVTETFLNGVLQKTFHGSNDA